MAKIINFPPRGYLNPEQQLAVVTEVQANLSERLHNNSLTFADILARMKKDVAEYWATQSQAGRKPRSTPAAPQPFNPDF